MKPSTLLTIMSIAITWLITVLVLLVYSFNYLDIINVSLTSSVDLKTVILIFTATFAVITLLVTGHLIDKFPQHIHKLFSLSLILSIISLIIIGSFGNTIIGVGFITLGMGLGGLTGVSGSYFGGFTKRVDRGKVYAGGIAVFALFSVLIITILNVTGDVNSTRTAMYVIASIGIIIFILFLFVFRHVSPWTNDEWPTRWTQILDRKTVQSYILTHFILYFMIGLAIQTISATGDTLTVEMFEPVDLFWAVVFLFDFLTCMMAGYIIDKKENRKNALILSIYVIALAILIFDLEKSLLTYLLSASLLGAAVSFVHVTIDSSIWADLAPRDAIGRYFSIGFTSLILGVSMGYSFGLIIEFLWSLQAINIAGLILILLTAISMFPLFFVADTSKPLEFSLLLTIFRDGMPCFAYNFGKPQRTSVDLPLLAGALHAISTFMSQTIDKNTDNYLNLVEHGDSLIVAEVVDNLTAAIFVNKGDPEIRSKLKEFLHVFNHKYHDQMENWYGDTSTFADAYEICEDIFGPLIPGEDFQQN